MRHSVIAFLLFAGIAVGCAHMPDLHPDCTANGGVWDQTGPTYDHRCVSPLEAAQKGVKFGRQDYESRTKDWAKHEADEKALYAKAEKERKAKEAEEAKEAEAKRKEKCELGKKYLTEFLFPSSIVGLLNNCESSERVTVATANWRSYENKDPVIAAHLAEISGFEVEANRLRRKIFDGATVTIEVQAEVEGKEQVYHEGRQMSNEELEADLVKSFREGYESRVRTYGGIVASSQGAGEYSIRVKAVWDRGHSIQDAINLSFGKCPIDEVTVTIKSRNGAFEVTASELAPGGNLIIVGCERFANIFENEAAQKFWLARNAANK